MIRAIWGFPRVFRKYGCNRNVRGNVRGQADHGSEEPTSMMTVVGCPFLLMNDAPQETWGQVGTWLVLSEARAQAPICSPSVFLLTRLKLWDLEHTLGCRDKVGSTQYTARQTVFMRSRGEVVLSPSPTNVAQLSKSSQSLICLLSLA